MSKVINIPRKSFNDFSDIDNVVQYNDRYNANLGYWNNANTKLIIKGGETYTNNAWAGSPGGTYSADTTNFLIYKQGVKLTATANFGAIHTVFPSTMDLTVFEDGSSSTSSDYIQIGIYISASDLSTLPSEVGFLFFKGSPPTNSNRAQYYINKILLSEGWNYFNFTKNSFSLHGTFDWQDVDGLEINKGSTVSASMSFTSDAIRLTRSNGSVANPMQTPLNGNYIDDITIGSGHWYIGVDHDKTLVLKELGRTGSSKLYKKNLYKDLTVSALSKCIVDNYANGVMLYNSDTDYIRLTVANNNLSLMKRENTSDTILTKACSLDINDLCRLTLTRTGTDLIGEVVINGDEDNKITISTTTSMTALVYPGIFTTAQEGEYLEFGFTKFTHNELLFKDDPLNNWQDYEPTYTWTTGTPEGSVTTVNRYTIVNNICSVNLYYSATDGNGATDLTITLPVTPKDNNSKIVVNSLQKVNTTWSNPLGYIDDDSGGVQFLNFSTCTDAQAVEINLSFFYEV